jgi:hypothetical protein
MVGAEESWRIKGGTISRHAARNRDVPNATYATGNNSITLRKNVYGKPGALFSVNRLSKA